MRCTVCGVNVPDFVWPEVGRPGGHYVIVDETPLTVRRVQDRPDDFERNVWTIVAEAKVKIEFCRDLHPELAALRDAQRGDPMRSVPGAPAVVRDAARWIDRGGVLDRRLPTPADLDAAHAAVMADADLLLGNPEAVRARNRAALLEEERRAGEILRENRLPPVKDAYPRRGWLDSLRRGRRRAED